MTRQLRLVTEAVFFTITAWLVITLFATDRGSSLSGSSLLNSGLESVKLNASLKINQQDLVAPGYTLLPVNSTEKVFLVNNQGKVLHYWNFDADRARLLPNGHIIAVHGSKWGMRNDPWKKLRPVVREYDWKGKIVWEFTAPDIAHHDITRLENGNTIFPVRSVISGNYKDIINDDAKRSLQIRSDSIYEVDKTGKVVWHWDAHDHLDLNSCGRRKCKNFSGKANAKDQLADWTHINTTSIIPPNKWYDSGDKRFKPGNIMTLPRNWWMTFIIEKESGEIVWEYGGEYRGGLRGGHEAHMIPRGLPGAGNILIFDNGRDNDGSGSNILEINPVTKKLVWVYDVGKDFDSRSAGSVQRLKNGNTLISEDVGGRVFEVNKQKEIVWELVLHDELRISRAHKYNLDYCPQFKNFS
ncbi:MAG: aryl-sulfate sulfotransferase [Bdellovibrionales bacterium]|nr:aryl-sulfate sulfotransferase [Bdellovibrionales bacterium]